MISGEEQKRIQRVEGPARVGYVVKRYPRYSETFIVNEILAHEAAGLEIEIFSLLPPEDGRFQDNIAEVRASTHYLPRAGVKSADFWRAFNEAEEVLPGIWPALREASGEDHRDVHQAVVLARLARLKGIQHLHAHFATSATTVARLASHFSGIPYTFTAHAKDIYHEDVEPADLRRKLRGAAAVVTVSDYNLRHLRKTFGSDAARVMRIYNGLDLLRFPYRKPDIRPPSIVSVGRLVEKKGFHDLIEACRILDQRNRPFHCSIIGQGPLEAELRGRIDCLGLRGKVELGGPRPQRAVIALVQGAAVFAAPCVVGEDGNRDGLPTVLLEAMALGTPCVSTDVTGIPELLQDGVTGRTVPERNPRKLADALEPFLDDSDLRVAVAERARALIESQYEIHRNSKRIRELYTEAQRTQPAAMRRVG